MSAKSWLLAGAFAGSCACAHAQEAAKTDALAQGKALYAVRCGICHAQGGFGTLMLGKRLGQEHALLAARTDIPVAVVELAVRNGINSMPPFTRVELTDAELKLIAVYLARPAQAR